MIRAVQKIQKDCENELPLEEVFINAPIAQQAPANPPEATDGNIYSGIELEKVLQILKKKKKIKSHCKYYQLLILIDYLR